MPPAAGGLVHGETTVARTIRADVSIGVLSTFVALLLLEAALRGFFPTLVDSPYHCVWPPGLTAVFKPDPAVMPGVTGAATVRCNSRGIRGDELPPGDWYTILTVGGSTTENLYLDQSESWPQLVQEELNRVRGTLEVWVGNIGRSGLTTRDHIVQMRYLLRELPRIDAVILLVGANDLTLRNLQASEYDPHFMDRTDAEEELMARAFAVYPLDTPALPRYRRAAVWQLARNLKRRVVAVGRESQDQGGKCYARWRSERAQARKITDAVPDLAAALDEYARNLRTLIGLLAERGIRPIFVTQPTMWRSDLPKDLRDLLWIGRTGKGRGAQAEYYSASVLAAEMDLFNGRLKETCRALRVECVDAAATVAKDTTVFFDDLHFNEAGSRALAGIIAQHLLAGPLAAPGITSAKR